MLTDITKKAEVVVIGAGPGGYVAAIRLAQLGKKIILIEEDKLGGICLNYGCIPSKALIYATGLYEQIKNSKKFGINVNSIKLDFKEMQKWKDAIVDKLRAGIDFLCKGNKIEVINGRAIFQSSNRLKIKNGNKAQFVEFEKCVIATGSEHIELKGFEFNGKDIISSKEALSLKEIPKSLVIIGGGYIGLELGNIFSKLGAKVKIVEFTGQILPGNDIKVVDVVKRHSEKSGIEFYLNTKAKHLERKKGKVFVFAESREKKEKLEADKVLVAVGRIPNTKNLGLENTKVTLDEKGFIKVDEKLKTEDENILAIGDVVSGPMLAHKASKQAKIVAEIIAGIKSKVDYSVVPAVIFTDPEIATVGLNEEDAKKEGYEILIGKFPLSASSRAMTCAKTEGFVKIIANKKDNRILGVQIVGQNASDLISEAAFAIEMGATLDDMLLTIHPHPTMPESLMEAAEAALGKAVHIFNPK